MRFSYGINFQFNSVGKKRGLQNQLKIKSTSNKCVENCDIIRETTVKEKIDYNV